MMPQWKSTGDSTCSSFFFCGLQSVFNCASWRGQRQVRDKDGNPQEAKAKVNSEPRAMRKDAATWKVMPFGNGRVKMKGLFKSVPCLLIPAVMYGLGSEMRCSLQQFPGNYRVLTSKTSQLRSSEQMPLSLDAIPSVGVSRLVGALCGWAG